MAVAGLVFGILSLVGAIFSWIPILSYFALPLSIVGVVLSAIAMKKQPEKKGMAIAGLVMSIIALVLSSILLIACTVCVACAAGAADAITGGITPLPVLALL